MIADPRYRQLLLERTTLRTQYLGLNCEMPPFDTVAVRQALNFAVDKRRLARADRRARRRRARRSCRRTCRASTPGWTPIRTTRRRHARASPPPGSARASPPRCGRRATTGRCGSRSRSSRTCGAIGVSLAIKPVDFPALHRGVRNPGHGPALPARLGGRLPRSVELPHGPAAQPEPRREQQHLLRQSPRSIASSTWPSRCR